MNWQYFTAIGLMLSALENFNVAVLGLFLCIVGLFIKVNCERGD